MRGQAGVAADGRIEQPLGRISSPTGSRREVSKDTAFERAEQAMILFGLREQEMQAKVNTLPAPLRTPQMSKPLFWLEAGLWCCLRFVCEDLIMHTVAPCPDKMSLYHKAASAAQQLLARRHPEVLAAVTPNSNKAGSSSTSSSRSSARRLLVAYGAGVRVPGSYGEALAAFGLLLGICEHNTPLEDLRLAMRVAEKLGAAAHEPGFRALLTAPADGTLNPVTDYAWAMYTCGYHAGIKAADKVVDPARGAAARADWQELALAWLRLAHALADCRPDAPAACFAIGQLLHKTARHDEEVSWMEAALSKATAQNDEVIGAYAAWHSAACLAETGKPQDAAKLKDLVAKAKDFEKRAGAYGLKEGIRYKQSAFINVALSGLKKGPGSLRRKPDGEMPVDPTVRDRSKPWTQCAECGSEEFQNKLLACAACKGREDAPRYCGVACQKKHWPQHKATCQQTIARRRAKATAAKA